MLLSKVNRRTSGAVQQPRKRIIPQNELKKTSQKQPAHIKLKSVANARNTKKTGATSRVKATELELLPPSDSDDEWASRSRMETYWRPLHRLHAKEPGADNHSVKAQAKVEFDNISKRINKVCDKIIPYLYSSS